MKTKLKFINVYTKRNIRDPIDWDAIEKIRNDGWELVSIVGSLSEAIRNPSVSPMYAIVRKEEVDDFELTLVKGQLRAANEKLAECRKKNK